jgi:hypothetical protein
MMSDGSVVISSPCAELRLSEPEGLGRAPGFAYFRVTLQKTDLAGAYMKVVASTQVLAYGPHGELSQFFDAMAAGEGEKWWESVGGVLTLRGTLYTPKESGHREETQVLVEVVLKSVFEDWWVKAELSLGRDRLEELAAQVRRFFSAMAKLESW